MPACLRLFSCLLPGLIQGCTRVISFMSKLEVQEKQYLDVRQKCVDSWWMMEYYHTGQSKPLSWLAEVLYSYREWQICCHTRQIYSKLFLWTGCGNTSVWYTVNVWPSGIYYLDLSCFWTYSNPRLDLFFHKCWPICWLIGFNKLVHFFMVSWDLSLNYLKFESPKWFKSMNGERKRQSQC